MGTIELSLEEEVTELRVRAVRESEVWAAGRGRVWRRKNDEEWQEILDPCSSFPKCLLGRAEISSRLLRLGVHDILTLGSGETLVVANGKIVHLTSGDQWRVVHKIQRGKRPLRQGITCTADGEIYYGEYWNNSDRRAVRIWGSFDGGKTWEPVYTFPEGEIRHVHTLSYDSFGDLIWVGTGDRDRECQIAYSDDGCRSFQPIGSGGQTWRATSLLFTNNSVFWGTDNPEGDNYLCRWDRAEEELHRVGSVVGPVYYSTKVGRHLIFSTAVERGEGEQDGYARLYALPPDGNLQEVFRLKKDFLHPVLFGYGWFEFPHGNAGENSFWAATKGLVGGRRSFLFQIED